MPPKKSEVVLKRGEIKTVAKKNYYYNYLYHSRWITHVKLIFFSLSFAGGICKSGGTNIRDKVTSRKRSVRKTMELRGNNRPITRRGCSGTTAVTVFPVQHLREFLRLNILLLY